MAAAAAAVGGTRGVGTGAREARAEDSSPGGGARAQGRPPSQWRRGEEGAARGRRRKADRWEGEERGLKGAGEKGRGIYCAWLPASLSFG